MSNGTELQTISGQSNGAEQQNDFHHQIKPRPVLTQNPSVHQIISPDDDDANSSVDENMEIASIASSLEDQLTWRGRMQVTLHSIPFEVFILSLVVADAFIVLFELLLDVGAFGNLDCQGFGIFEQSQNCHYDRATRDLCGPPPNLILDGTNLTEGNGSTYCACRFSGGQRVCAPFQNPIGLNPAFVLHVASILILSTFMLEVLAKLIAFRFKYFTHKFETFDGLIVVLSWILDVASIIREESFASVATLLIVLRLWRVVRIVNAAALGAKAQADRQLHVARAKVRNVVHALHKSQDKFKAESERVNELEKILTHQNIPVPERKKKALIPSYPYDQEEGFRA